MKSKIKSIENHTSLFSSLKKLTRISLILSVLISFIWTCLYHYLFFSTMIWSLFCGMKGRFSNELETSFVFYADPQIEGSTRIREQGTYGWLSVAMNDYYFKVISQNIVKYIRPHYIVVMGDIISHPFIKDTEFQSRTDRFKWYFDEELIHSEEIKLINLTGNHDVGYAADLKDTTMNRWQEAYGTTNFRFETGGHIVGVVNSMAVEQTKLEELHLETLGMIEQLKYQRQTSNKPLILLTHIPLHKPSGSCPGDDPYTKIGNHGFITVQNLWLENTTQWILDELQPILVFDGHDHSGCIYKHNNTQKTLEITVRSVMGDWGGHIGYLEISKERNGEQEGKFKYQYFSTNFVVIYFLTFLSIVSLVVLVLDILFISANLFFFFFSKNNNDNQKMEKSIKKE